MFIVPTLARAGAENQVVSLANGLPATSFEKHLLTYRPGGALVKSVSKDDVTLHELKKSSRIDLSLAKDIASVIDEHRIDIIHCTLQNALVYGLLARAYSNSKPKLICALHTTENVDFKNEFVDQVLHRHLLKKCEQIWFVCNSQAQYWIARMPFLKSRHYVVYNGIDVEHFDRNVAVGQAQDLRDRLGLDNDFQVISCIAGFRPEKGHCLLLEAFQTVLNRHNKCALLLGGRGPLEQQIRQHMHALGLEKRVFFLGELGDVRPLLAASSCKVLASTAVETFSMAILEAMAMQVPVVSSRIGGASEAVEDNVTGFLVQPGNVVELASRLTEMLTDEEARRKMGEQARQVVTSKFSRFRMIESSAQLLNQVIASEAE